MRIFVAGATGAIGIYAVRALLAAGHQVTAISRSTAKAEILDALGAVPKSEGSRVLVTAALKAGIPTVIQEFVSMIYRDRSDEWIDEEWPTDRFPMSLGNHAAEASANHFTEQGGTGIVLRFGWFYGPGAAHSEEFFLLAQRYRLGVMMGAANTYVSSIHMVAWLSYWEIKQRHLLDRLE